MSNVYETMYGARLNGKHTFADYGLYPVGKLVIPPAAPRVNYVVIPGADGSLDLSEALTGRPVYEDREVAWQFKYVGDEEGWPEIVSRIANELHGRRVRIDRDGEREFYWMGRAAITENVKNNHALYITLNIQTEPYKYYSGAASDEPWEWDTFSFETGVIREYGEIRVDGTRTVTVVGTPMPVAPVFAVTLDSGQSSMTLEYKGEDYTLYDGENLLPEVVLYEGESELKFTGYGVVSVRYRGGSL